MVKKFLIGALICFFSSFCPHSHVEAAQSETLSIVYCADCTPFQFQDERGEPAGMIIDHWKLWSKKTGIPVDYQPAPWDKTLVMARNGVVDAHAGLFYSKARDAYLLYSSATLRETDTHLFYHQTLSIQDNDGMMPYRVGVIKGDYLEEYLYEKYPDLAVIGYSSFNAMMEDLKNETLRVFAADTLTGITHLQKSDLASRFQYKANTPLYRSKWYVAVPEGRHDILEMIETGMNLISTQEKHAITRHWVTTSGSRDPNTLVIAVDRNYPPFSMVDPEGKPTGLLVDFWRLWSNTSGESISFMPVSWAETIDVLKTGEADIHFGLFKNPEREAWMDFSLPLHEIETAIYVPAGKGEPTSLEQFSGKRVAVMAGSYQARYLWDNYSDIKIVELPDGESMILALLKGEVNALVHEIVSIEAELAHLRLTRALKRSRRILCSNQVHAGVQKGNAVLLEKINKWFATIPLKQMAEIESHWIFEPSQRYYLKSGSAPLTVAQLLTSSEKAWLKAHSVIRVGFDPHYIPFEFENEKGEFSGVTSEYIGYLEQQLGVKFSSVPGLTWPRVMEKIQARDLDMVPSVMHTPQRSLHMRFSKPYLSFPVVIFSQKQAPFIGGLEDLVNRRVAVVEGYVIQENLTVEFPELTLHPFPTAKQALKALAVGDVDAFVNELPSTGFLINSQGLTNIKVAAATPYHFDLSMGIRKDWPELVDILNKALNTITPETASEFKGKWFSLTYEHKTDIVTILKWVLPIFGTLAAICIVFVVWNRRLGAEVSERKAAEAKIRAMSDASHDAVIMINGQGQVMFWNSAAKAMFGYSADEVFGEKMHALFVPEEVREDANRGMAHFSKTGTGPVVGTTIEHEAINRSGKRFPVEIAVSSFQMEDAWYAVGTIRDITARKEIEAKIKAAREELLLIFDNSQVGIMLIHNRWEIARINHRMLKILGYEDPRELIGYSMNCFHLDKDIFDDFKSKCIPFLLKGKKSSCECQLRRKDGTMVWCSLTGNAVDQTLPPDLDKGVIWVVDNITQRKQMADELKQSEENFRIIADYAYDWESWHDQTGRLLWVNPAVERITGYSVDNCIEMKDYPIPFIHEEDRNIFETVKEQALNGLEGKNKTFRVVHKTDSREIWAAISWNPVHDDEGAVTGFRTSIRDITESKKAEDEMTQHLADLETFSRLAVSREERMIDLKAEVNQLLLKLGEEKKYIIR